MTLPRFRRSVPTCAVSRSIRNSVETRRAFRQVRRSWRIFDNSWKSSARPLIGLGVLFRRRRCDRSHSASSGSPLAKTGNYYSSYRQDIGRAILLGLEFRIAGDIIRTVVVAPTIQNVLVLGLIVLIRTFLSLSLQLEIEGRLPWRRAGLPPD